VNPCAGVDNGLDPVVNHVRQILWFWEMAILCGLLLFPVACGKKGPPVPPKSKIPSAVQDINYNVQGSTVRLSWPVADTDVSDDRKIVSFRVYRSVRPENATSCPGCPVPFELAGEVPAAGASKEGFVEYIDQLSPGDIFYYKIVPVSENGVAEVPSQVIKIADY